MCMCVIIETISFTALQNLAQRGHAEDLTNLCESSYMNQGNFMELIHQGHTLAGRLQVAQKSCQYLKYFRTLYPLFRGIRSIH